MNNWAEIPCVILLEIMQYLSRRDRLSCGMVCKSWYMTMINPLLWKNMHVCLDVDLTDPLTIVTTKRYAAHINSIDLAWSKPYIPRRWLRNRMTTVAHDTCQYLMLLKDFHIILTHLKLTDWYFTWKFKKVVYHLSLFLKQQRSLKYLNLSNAYLNKTEILKILTSCRASGLTITYLNLQCAFHEWHNVFSNINYINALQHFPNLQVFKIDYSSISDKTLLVFVQNGNESLKFIEINVRDVDSRSHVISSETWAKISECCKQLKVALHFYNICHYEDIYYILVATIPLHTFSLNCGHVWDQSRTRNYCETLNLLINNFEKTLEHVTLQLRNNQEMVDCCLYRMIRKCKKLKYLEFDGVLRTVDLLRDICALHIENWKGEHEDHFKFFHVRPRNASLLNNLIISDVWRSYTKQMEEKHVDFQIESYNNATVRIFC